ncbi:MAG: HD-GYP domain-containing protein [Pyrinomonadaceae bacterium]
MNSILAENPEIDEKLYVIASETDGFECYGSPHAGRIAAIADSLAEAFNIAPRDRIFLKQAALLHDIGEKRMNRDYISSPRGLTSTELIDLHRHPVIGEQEAAKLGLPRSVQLNVRWHHEWWNGGGYPDALENEQIPLAARILRVADTFAALTAARPYRAALPAEEAKKLITEWAGIEFDPAIVKAFLSIEEPELARSAAFAPEPPRGGLSII